MEKDYKDTLNLPKTDFPMKANLALKEPEIIKIWDEKNIYNKMITNRSNAQYFILHDGPPYANGNIHPGTILNKILKDIVVKYKNLAGFCCEYIPGWDCHGLPIEHSVMKELGGKNAGLGPLEIRKKCHEFAMKFVNIQRDEFKRLGVLGDWENPYLTVNRDYESTIVSEFGKFVERGTVYKGRKPVYWCHVCETALAEAEVEYQDLSSPSIYVKFPFRNGLDERIPELKGKKGSVVIWTTTPWTLPANLAIALHPKEEYVASEINGEVMILAKSLLANFHMASELPEGKIIATFPGSALEGAECSHPFIDRSSLIILGEHVTMDTGTGCVHTAPGHGQEDYEVGLQYDLDVYAPVDEKGRFTSDVPQFQGRMVFDTDHDIVKLLREKGVLIRVDEIKHSYPHCWRSKNPVIFRATSQWFISIDKTDMRHCALSEIDKVQWIPPWGLDRIRGMVINRPDWCISRQRVWGVPIIVFVCEKCGEALLNAKVVKHVAGIFLEQGSDAWFIRNTEELIPSGVKCGKCGGKSFRKSDDIIDVWFESGVSYAAVIEKKYGFNTKTDLYLEGSDQHRGWFQSAILASVGTRDQAPYNAVLTHGFVVDGEGKKMSKSLGNYIPPDEVIDKNGAEIFRLWVSAEDYRDDIRLSKDILSRLVEAYRKFRNTFRFLLGNLYDFNPEKDAVDYSRLHFLDKWALNRLHELMGKIHSAYENYEFHVIFHAVKDFCAVDLSAFYLDIIKDRLYCSGKNSIERRGAQTAIYAILRNLVIAFSPILSFTCEEVYQHVPKKKGDPESVFMCDFPAPDCRSRDESIDGDFKYLIELREKALKEMELKRAQKEIGHPLDAHLKFRIKHGSLYFNIMKKYDDFLPSLFIVSQISFEETEKVNDETGIEVSVLRAEGNKCARCWNYSTSVGSDPVHSDCCSRCVSVLKNLQGFDLSNPRAR